MCGWLFNTVSEIYGLQKFKTTKLQIFGGWVKEAFILCTIIPVAPA